MERRIELEGELNQGDAEAFGRLLAAEVEELLVDCPGGSLREALNIGRLIRDRNFRLRIRRLCASACASVLLPAAREVWVEEGSLIAIHAGDPGMHRAALRLGRFVSPAEQELARRGSGLVAELQAFEKSVDRSKFFERAEAITGYADLDLQVEHDESGELVWSVLRPDYRVAEYWLPGAATLRALGISVNDWRPCGAVCAVFRADLWPWRVSRD